MPLMDIKLVPGVNSQVTLTQNTAGISVSNLIRFKEGLVQKMGGWQTYYPFSVSSYPIRDIHAFQGLRNQQKFLGIGATGKLSVITGSSLLQDITPQYLDTAPTPSFSVTAGSNLITVKDPGSSANTFGGVRFDTPVALPGTGILLSGAYPIASVADANTYTIISSNYSLTTVSSVGQLPIFYCGSGTAFIDVELPYNGFISAPGIYYPFTAPTTVDGITIQGPYTVTSIIDSTHFQIGSPTQTTGSVSSGSPVTMNAGKAALHHYIALGPAPAAGAYGAGNYGANLYGLGTPPTQGTGTPITATDWVLDNWGEALVAIPQNGPLYVWAPDVGLQQAQAITINNAPQYNLGGFVGQPQQIMFMWGTTDPRTDQFDPLLIRWSDSGAQAGYLNWLITTTSFAGSFHIPTGSTLRGGVQAPLFAVFWTDIDVWTAQYIGQPLIYSFTRVGTGAGTLGPHAMDVQAGVVYWAGTSNFFMLGPNGVQVLPCTVWDIFFSQIDWNNATKVRCAANSVFNEITWYYPILPALGGTGENTNYVKVHIEGAEYEWDYGTLSRTAWVDVTAVGNPIGADNNGFLYQHEESFDANGAVINAAIETGYFEIGDGTQFVFVDWVLPDAKWGQYTGGPGVGILLFTFYTADYANQQPERVYGPYPVTQGNPYINCRMRGRFWRMRVENQDINSFWRLGKVMFRWAPAGRR